jgi:hypothetical protein
MVDWSSDNTGKIAPWNTGKGRHREIAIDVQDIGHINRGSQHLDTKMIIGVFWEIMRRVQVHGGLSCGLIKKRCHNGSHGAGNL